ncbi:MAG: hypothetical protein ACRDHZ_09035 [Ktedonobacteraceae bacterium]
MIKEYEEDYEFENASGFEKSYRQLSDSVSHPAARPIAIAFQRNIERVVQLNTFPLEVIHWSSVIVRAYEKLLTPNDFDKLTTAEGNEVAWISACAVLKQLLQVRAGTKKRTSRIEYQEHLSGGLESILYAMLSASYAAFEAAATDCWIELMNSDVDAVGRWIKDNRDKSITLAELAGESFNLSKGMGTYLHRSQKVSFLSLRDIKKAYDLAYPVETTSYFGPESGLREAESVRHLLAHRSGVIDAKFKQAMVAVPAYEDQQIGSFIRVTGPMVNRNVYASVKAGMVLIKFADQHLTALAS